MCCNISLFATRSRPPISWYNYRYSASCITSIIQKPSSIMFLNQRIHVWLTSSYQNACIINTKMIIIMHFLCIAYGCVIYGYVEFIVVIRKRFVTLRCNWVEFGVWNNDERFEFELELLSLSNVQFVYDNNSEINVAKWAN